MTGDAKFVYLWYARLGVCKFKREMEVRVCGRMNLGGRRGGG